MTKGLQGDILTLGRLAAGGPPASLELLDDVEDEVEVDDLCEFTLDTLG